MSFSCCYAYVQVLFVSDPELLPTLFDRSLYPPNANVLDRPVDTFLKKIDAVQNSKPGFPHQRCNVTIQPLPPAQSLLDATLAEFACCKHVAMSIQRIQLPRACVKMSKFATLQMTSDSGQPNLLTAKTGDPLWRLVRKGVAPAFNPQNIRCRTSFD